MAFRTQPIVVGDTIDFILTVQKDSVTWDISGGTVLLYLRNPAGTVVGPLTATISNGPAGVAHYLTGEATLNLVGDWIRQWKVSNSGTVLWSESIPFSVQRAAA